MTTPADKERQEARFQCAYSAFMGSDGRDGFKTDVRKTIAALDKFDADWNRGEQEEQMRDPYGTGSNPSPVETDCGGEDREPELPSFVTSEDKGNYFNGRGCLLSTDHLSVDELKQIAAIVTHRQAVLRWRERQATRPQVTDKMIKSAYRAWDALVPYHHPSTEQLRAVIQAAQAALAAMPKDDQ